MHKNYVGTHNIFIRFLFKYCTGISLQTTVWDLYFDKRKHIMLQITDRDRVLIDRDDDKRQPAY